VFYDGIRSHAKIGTHKVRLDGRRARVREAPVDPHSEGSRVLSGLSVSANASRVESTRCAKSWTERRARDHTISDLCRQLRCFDCDDAGAAPAHAEGWSISCPVKFESAVPGLRYLRPQDRTAQAERLCYKAVNECCSRRARCAKPRCATATATGESADV
jgi:hypothetical protein